MRKIKIIFFVFVIAAAILLPIYLYFNIYLPIRAEGETVISAQSIDSDSKIVEKNDVINFIIDSRDKTSLLKTKKAGVSGAYSLIQKIPKYRSNNEIKDLIPVDFAANARLTRMVEDKSGKSQHYCYQQNVDGIPVYGGDLCLHFKNKTELDSVSGNLIKNYDVVSEKIDKKNAERIALDQAKLDIKNEFEIKIYESKTIIYNEKLLGIGENTGSRPVQEIRIASNDLEDQKNIYLTKFLIDLTDSKILEKRDLVAHVLTRAIFDCSVNPKDCPLKRTEGAPPTGITDIDSAYNFFGNTYNFYKTTFARDSYDNLGANLKVLTYTPAAEGMPCPNAAWITTPYNQWQFCAGMVVGDIVAHEYTHAVTEHTANLALSNQSGALNESISDIFAYAVNPANWTLGEGSSRGITRNMQNPSASVLKQPDRLFSPNYFCSADDSGGIHINSGIINKAFYLMTDGGDFNGCKIVGQGREKTAPIIYRALTTYLTQTSNFLSFYTAVANACADLYGGENSTTCQYVKRAMQSVEIDQQPIGNQTGAKCLNILPKTPGCTTPIRTPTLTNTPLPGATNTPTLTPTPTPTKSPTPTPLNVTKPTTTPASTTKVVLNIKVKLQGTTAGSTVVTKEIPAKITVKRGAVVKDTIITLKFNGSIWTGTTELDIPEKDDYAILIKGPSHIRKRICDLKPTEQQLGTYNCSTGEISLKKGINDLDFSGIYLMTGDVDQDGVVDAVDLSHIKTKLGALGQLKEDVNFDQVVDTQDFALVVQSLLFKQDEE